MGSVVSFTDLDSQEEKTISLVYPQNADVTAMKISILSPVGSALIGLRIGGNIDRPAPNGNVRRLKVIAVQQPAKYWQSKRTAKKLNTKKPCFYRAFLKLQISN